MILLTAALIVRDEAAALSRCLHSLGGLVDEIVVVDTGSSDDSPRIAAAFGARVIHHDWQHDFSAARNLALSHARGQWILYIDADECAQPLSRDTLAATLLEPGSIAASVRFRSRTGFTRYRECRLFRNDPRIRFRNVIHETMMNDIEAAASRDGARIGTSDLAIDHFGYDQNQEGKHRRNIPLLRARLARDPEHIYSWNHLGEALAGLGDMTGALAAWRHAIGLVRASGTRRPLDALPFSSLLLSQDAAASALGFLDEALERFPGNYLFKWLRGRRLADEGNWAAGLAILEEVAAIDPATFCSDDGVAYDARIFGAGTYEVIALCHFRLGHYPESARWYELAQSEDPGNPAHDVRRRLAAARAGQA